MQKMNITRRRGTSIAAAALSMALVAPVVQPVVVPGSVAKTHAAEANEFADDNHDQLGDRDSDFNKNPQGEGWNPDPQQNVGSTWRHVYWATGGIPGTTQPKRQNDGSYDVDAIASGQVGSLTQLSNFASTGKDVVSGRAMVVTPRSGAQLQATYDGFEPLPNEIPVYFQWMDSDGAVSPVYSTHTNNKFGPGRYAFAVPEWIDAKGKKHRFRAQYGQKYQVWAEPTNDPDTQNELVPMRQVPGMVPGAFGNGSGEGLGEFPGQVGTNGNIQRTGVFMYERPCGQGDADENYMKVDLAAGQTEPYKLSDPKRPINDPLNHKAQLIYDDLGRMRNAGAHYDKTYHRTVSGKVWLENGNERQLFKGASPAFNDPARGDVGYRVYATALTSEGAQEYDSFIQGVQAFNRADETKKWIIDNPQYVAGTVFGKPNEDGEYTLRFPDDVFGSNAYTLGAVDQFQRHLYMWVEDENHRVVPGYSTWTQPVFQDPRNNLQWAPTADPVVNNAASASGRYSRFDNVNFALVAANDATINITSHDNTGRPARRGDLVHAELKGDMPVGATVQWRNASGRVLKECKGIETASDMKGCDTFDVPVDASDGEFFYVALTNGYNDIALDSFIVIVERPQWNDTVQDVSTLPNDPTKGVPVTLPNVGKKDPLVKPTYTVTELEPEVDKDGDVIKDAQGNPKLKEKRVLASSEYEMSLADDTIDLTFAPQFAPQSGQRFRIDVSAEYQAVDPVTKQPLFDQDSSGNQIPRMEQQHVDSATITYRGYDEAYQPEYGTFVYDFKKQTSFGKWTRGEFKPTFTDEAGNPVELKNVPLMPKGDAFIVNPNDLPAGWHDVQDRAKVNRNDPGSFSIDRGPNTGSNGIGPNDRGMISFVPWDNNGAKDYQQVLRASGPVVIPVTVNYADGTSDKVKATIVYEVDETDVYDVKYGEVIVVPGQENVLSPVLTHKDGRRLETIEDAKYQIPTDLPAEASDEDRAAFDEYKKALEQGYKVSVDQNTGALTVVGPPAADDKTVKKFSVPVTVTYKDGSSEPASPATVLLDSNGDGVPEIRDVQLDPPSQTRDEGQEIDPIRVTPGDPNATIEVENLPEGLNYDPETKLITGTPKVTWEDGETEKAVSVTVRVTNEDGTTATKTAHITVVKDREIRVQAIPNIEVPINVPINAIPLRVTETKNPDKQLEDAEIEVFWYDENGVEAEKIKGLEIVELTDSNTENPTKYKAIAGTPTELGVRNVLIRATYGDKVDQTFLKITVTNELVIDRTKDSDDDKLTDAEEITGEKNPYGTPDTKDGKLVSKPADENNPGAPTNPFSKDTDGDGVSDFDEINRVDKDGKPAPTDPNNPDTDGDGVNDGDEEKFGTDPTDPKAVPPTITPGNEIDVIVTGQEPKKIDDEVKNPTGKEEGVVKDKDGNPIKDAKVEINPKNGEIKVSVPEGTPEGSATVVITTPGKNGGTETIGEIPIVIVKPGSRAFEFQPNYGDATNVKADESKTVKVDWKKNAPKPGQISKVEGVKSDGADDWTVTTEKTTGDVTAKAPSLDQIKAAYKKVDPTNWNDFVEKFAPYARPTETVTFTYDDGSHNTAEAKFDLVGQDGKSILDPDGDFDGDGVTNREEIEGNTNPFDSDSKTVLIPGSVIEEIKQGGTEKLDDKVKNRTDNTTGEVYGKDGQKIEGAEVTIDRDGNITVKLPENATPGIGRVIIKDKDGKQIGDLITIVITPKDVPAPSVKDDGTKDQIPADGSGHKVEEKVDNPTTGMTGEVQDKDGKSIDGATVKIDPETGEITVTVPEGTQPAEDAKVIVKDKNGKEVGEVTIDIVTPGPTITPGTKVEEIQPGGSKELDDRVKNSIPGLTGEVKDKDGNTITDAKVIVDGEGKITVELPKDAPVGPATVQILDKDGNEIGDPIHIVVTPTPAPAPNVKDDGTVDKIPADGSGHPVKETVQNPTTGMTGEVIGSNGKIDGATVKVDPETGQITVTVPEGTPTGDATVVVKDKDGHKVGEVKIEITTPAPSIHSDGKVDEIKPGETKEIGDKVKNAIPGLTGEVKDKGGNKIEGATVTVDDKTGKITVELPKDAPTGPATVQILDKDGNEIGNPINIVVTPTPAPTPSITDGSKKDEIEANGQPQPIDDKVENPKGGLTGEVVIKDENGNDKKVDGAKVTIDTDGNITVSVPEGTAAGDATVVIKDGDATVGKPIEITITEPKKDAPHNETFKPDFTDEVTGVRPGGNANTKDPFNGQNPPLKNVTPKAPAGAEDWAFNQVGNSGVINGTAPSNEKIGEKIAGISKDGVVVEDQGKTRWETFVDKLTAFAEPTVTVNFEFRDGTEASDEAKFAIVGQDGKSILDPDGDFDGDGLTNKEEIEGKTKDGTTFTPTDPTKGDTDGDGASDGQEAKKGTNPRDPKDFPSDAAPWLVIGGNYTGTVGQKIGDILVTSDKDATVTVNGLPAGLTFQNGTISGTPSEAGTFKVTVTAAKNGQTISRDVTFTIADKPAAKTTVDTTGVKPVDPTDQPQPTGITVTNSKPATTVEAKDEDGQKVKVEIVNGKVVVTPNKDVNGNDIKVDGPITVTISDPDLPGGKVTVDVPVNGHKKGSDDNGNGNPKSVDKDLCYGTLASFGLPMLLLIPLGIATTVAIPGLEQMTRPIQEQIKNANNALQNQLGIMNPQMAAQMEQINNQLRGVGANLLGVAAGLAILSAGVTAITITAVNCAPGAGQSGSSVDVNNSFRKAGERSSAKDYGSSIQHKEVPAGEQQNAGGSSN